MKIFLISTWLFIGLAGIIFHLGPGRELEKQDFVRAALSQARTDVQHERWLDAIDRFDQALDSLPKDQPNSERHIRLEKAKAQMMAAQLPEARLALESLLDEIVADSLQSTSTQGDRSQKNNSAELKTLARETRLALASSQYYLTWLMRLEGLGREEWEPEVEAARQNYRLLMEQAELAGDASIIEKRREDLEATIRLARMDLSELQALPLPCQCSGCCSGKCRGKGKRPSNQKSGQAGGFQKPDDGSGS
ncbi:MAG: hypothetical protein KF851_00150 [Pirellulaceae bacterium]|nr:hypothetical protein [Pirellulaceae bacterium]